MRQVISGSSNKKLSAEIANFIGSGLLETRIENFSDGELKIQILDKIGPEVIIVQSTSHPANDHLMELLLLADAAKRAGAQEITAVMPYFGYSRQDRHTYKHGPISAGLVAKILEASGVTKIITLDLHSPQLEGIFNIPIINLDSSSLLLPHFKDRDNMMIISPDIGGIARARNFCGPLKLDLAIINKSRDKNNQCSMSEVIGDVNGKGCLIVDDILDSGTTICMAADLLLQKGATKVEAYITHPVLSKGALDKIEQSCLNQIYVSDSIFHRSLPAKFTLLPICELIGKALMA
jgi:ribose-phosphate pyrophosphokinase